MNSRITAILIGLLSVTGVFATTVIEQNDSITNEIVSDSITMAMPSDSITIQVTDTDSIARQQEADKNLLSLLETDSTEQILPVIKMLRMLEYADSIRAMQGSAKYLSTHFSYLSCSKNRCLLLFNIYPRPKNAHSNQSLFRWTINGYKTRFKPKRPEI